MQITTGKLKIIAIAGLRSEGSDVDPEIVLTKNATIPSNQLEAIQEVITLHENRTGRVNEPGVINFSSSSGTANEVLFFIVKNSLSLHEINASSTQNLRALQHI